MKSKKCFLFYLDKKLLLDKRKSYLIGRNPEFDIHLPEKTVSRKHAYIKWHENNFVIYDLNSKNGIFVNSQKVKKKLLYDHDKIRIGNYYLEYRICESNNIAYDKDALSASDTIMLENKMEQILKDVKNKSIIGKLNDLKGFINKNKTKLKDMAYKDRLTNLYNRRYFDDRFRQEVERAKRYIRELCFIIIDIDHFKSVNDKYGHQKGDEVLEVIANIISKKIRQNDIIARYGGEEIVIILPETSLKEAVNVAKKLRLDVQNESFKKTGIKITISLGVSQLNKTSNSVEKIIASADKALYIAKKTGRNKVVCSSDDNNQEC